MLMTARTVLGLTPHQFWYEMTLVEFLTEMLHRNYYATDPNLAGGLSRADVDRLMDLLDE